MVFEYDSEQLYFVVGITISDSFLLLMIFCMFFICHKTEMGLIKVGRLINRIMIVVNYDRIARHLQEFSQQLQQTKTKFGTVSLTFDWKLVHNVSKQKKTNCYRKLYWPISPLLRFEFFYIFSL